MPENADAHSQGARQRGACGKAMTTRAPPTAKDAVGRRSAGRGAGKAVLRRGGAQEAEMYDAYDARILLTLGSATAKQ